MGQLYCFELQLYFLNVVLDTTVSYASTTGGVLLQNVPDVVGRLLYRPHYGSMQCQFQLSESEGYFVPNNIRSVKKLR